MNTEIDRCPRCNGVIALVGRMHNCIPRADIVQALGDARERERREKALAEAEPKLPPEFFTNIRTASEIEAERLAAKATKPKRSREPMLAQGAGPAPAKKSATYAGYKDPDARRAYQRELMRKRRAKT